MVGDELAAFLAGDPPGGDVGLLAWRFEQSVAEVVRIGMRDGQLGGPYEAPSSAVQLGGSLELRWSDGRVTRTTFGREALSDLAAHLEDWRAEASPVRLVASVAPPTLCPDVATADPAVAALVTHDPAPLLDLQEMAVRRLAEYGVLRGDVSVSASAGRRRVMTSAGFDVRWDETGCRLDVGTEDLHNVGFSKRRMPSDQEAELLADDAAATTCLLREIDRLSASARGVLFALPATDALLARFLGTNLDGRAVVGGHGRFTTAHFDEGRQVFDARLNVMVDTTLPFERATAPCSSDGIPASRAVLIRAGCLVTPGLDREHAARLGRAPTPAPRGRPSLLLETSGRPLDVPAALVELGDGAIVRTMLGLHTQNARTGDYAVVAPHAQAVRAGRPGGRVAVRVRGNLFEQLAAPNTRLVRFPGSVTPGLLVLGADVLEST